MLVAITGATGLVGSHTVQMLKAAGHQVRALKRPASRVEGISQWVDEWCDGEFYQPQAQAALAAGAEVMIHAAYDWQALQQAPQVNAQRNLLGALGLLEQSRLAGVEQFLFVSSGAVYHEILPGGKLDERHATWPGDIYGATKAAIEPYLKSYHVQYGMNTSSWRPTAIYGIDPKLAKSQWYDLVEAVRAGRSVQTAKGGKIVDVRDVAGALVAAIGDEQTAGEFYNLVDGYFYWQRAAELAKEMVGGQAHIIEAKGPGPKNQYDTAKAQEFFNRHGNHQALRRGEAGVREYIQQLIGQMNESA